MAAAGIPPECDLRRCGWRLVQPAAGEPVAGSVVSLAPVNRMDAAQWLLLIGGQGACQRGSVLLHGVVNGRERARYLSLGFGDVLGCDVDIAELDARARSLLGRADMVPRRRRVGRLELDLLSRRAYVDGCPVRLFPREFGLLWRLAETPGERVSKRRLLKDVWGLSHIPETNSLEVHVHRLRENLKFAGLCDVIRTDEAGGYRLDPQCALPAPAIRPVFSPI